MQLSAAEKLRQLPDRPGLLAMPGCMMQYQQNSMNKPALKRHS